MIMQKALSFYGVHSNPVPVLSIFVFLHMKQTSKLQILFDATLRITSK